MKLSLTFSALLLLVGCPPNPVNPPPDADAAGPTTDAAPAPVDAMAPEAAPPVADAAPVPDGADRTVDAGPIDVVARVCVNLVKLNCPEGCGGVACFDGGGATCASLLTHLKSTPLTEPKFDCVAGATSQAAVRACGPAWKDACQAPATTKKGK